MGPEDLAVLVGPVDAAAVDLDASSDPPPPASSEVGRLDADRSAISVRASCPS